jgi:hypothetical protein
MHKINTENGKLNAYNVFWERIFICYKHDNNWSQD